MHYNYVGILQYSAKGVPACICPSCVAESVVRNGLVRCLILPVPLQGFGEGNSETLLYEIGSQTLSSAPKPRPHHIYIILSRFWLTVFPSSWMLAPPISSIGPPKQMRVRPRYVKRRSDLCPCAARPRKFHGYGRPRFLGFNKFTFWRFLFGGIVPVVDN